MNPMRPAAGAFATQAIDMPARPSVAAPAPVVAPQGHVGAAPDPNALLAKLASMGLLGGPGGAASTNPASAPAAGAPPVGTAAPLPDPFIELQSLMSRMPPRPIRKGTFQPGAPGRPKSGMRAHEILNDPAMVATLQERLATWEGANPGKKLMGSHIQQMLPEVSAAQARTIKRLLDKALNKNAAVDMGSLVQRGAAKALRG